VGILIESEYGQEYDWLNRVQSTVQVHIGKGAAVYGNNPIRGILAYPNQQRSWGGAPIQVWRPAPKASRPANQEARGPAYTYLANTRDGG